MFDAIPLTLVLLLIAVAGAGAGFAYGFEIGSPVMMVDEIIWVERLPQEMTSNAYELSCEILKREAP